MTKWAQNTVVRIGIFSLLLAISSTTFFVQRVQAAQNDGVGGSGYYEVLQFASTNALRVYATEGEYINFSVSPGVRHTGAQVDCAFISIRDSGGTNLTPDAGGGAVSTCNSNEDPRSITISYRVPTGTTITDPSQAFKVLFDASFQPGGKLVDPLGNTQGYKWRVWVSSDVAGTTQKQGRVWFDGSTKLHTWQNREDSTLSRNSANFKFRYVRKDGYRYDVQYYNLQGIWTDFTGDVYGSAIGTTPAYTSFSKRGGNAVGLKLPQVADAMSNQAYVFTDCSGALNGCPSDIGFFRSEPITGSGVDDSGTSGGANPIGLADPNSASTDTTKFRYTNYSPAVNQAGGMVKIPYTLMQSGYIRVGIKVDSVLVCQVDILINDADGSGEIDWPFTQAGMNDSTMGCQSGTWKGITSEPFVDPDVSLNITAQGVNLGEMHFTTTDTEQLGGVMVYGNGLGNDTQKHSISWYDPFARSSSYTCGPIPVRVGDGSAATGSGGWDSMSSGLAQEPGGVPYQIPVTGTSTTAQTPSNSGVPASKWRMAVNSNVAGGVHGWRGADTCDYTLALATIDGYSGTESTWGNDRNIENWASAYVDPVARSIRVGGAQFNLTPGVSVPTAVVPGTSYNARPSVQNDGRSPATSVNWVLSKIVFSPGASIDRSTRESTNVGQFSCGPSSRAVGAQSCAVVATSAGPTATFNANSTAALSDYTVPGADTATLTVGTVICFSLQVNPYDDSGLTTMNYREAVSCTTIASAPYLVGVGGNIWAGGSTISPYDGIATITGAASMPSGFGSFDEYGLFATGTISGFGSGGQLAVGTSPMTTGTSLTFANSSVPLGNYTGSHAIADFSTTCTPVVGDVTVAATNLTAGQVMTVCAPNNTVTIAGDVTYDTATGVASFKDAPQFRVIAKDIIIKGAVQRIDGLLFARDSFVTCEEGPTTPGPSAAITVTGVCSKQLIINGAVILANTGSKLVANRSYGGDAAGRPAEMVRMRPEVYMTPFEKNAASQGVLLTVQESELPPRY